MASLMSIECLKVILIIYGSKIPEYYSYEKEDGFKVLRYVSLIIKENLLYRPITLWSRCHSHV